MNSELRRGDSRSKTSQTQPPAWPKSETFCKVLLHNALAITMRCCNVMLQWIVQNYFLCTLARTRNSLMRISAH